MKLRSCMVRIWVLLAANLIYAQVDADPYPPADQKRPALALKSHGIFWAGGEIVNRTQSGTQNAGDLKDIPYNQQQVLVGQAYVEYFIPNKLRNGKSTLPVVMVPGGALIGVHFLTTPDGREGWAHYFLRRGFPVYIVDLPGAGAPVSCPISSTMSKRGPLNRTLRQRFERGIVPLGWSGIPGHYRRRTRPMARMIQVALATMHAIRRIRRSIATAT